MRVGEAGGGGCALYKRSCKGYVCCPVQTALPPQERKQRARVADDDDDDDDDWTEVRAVGQGVCVWPRILHGGRSMFCSCSLFVGFCHLGAGRERERCSSQILIRLDGHDDFHERVSGLFLFPFPRARARDGERGRGLESVRRSLCLFLARVPHFAWETGIHTVGTFTTATMGRRKPGA